MPVGKITDDWYIVSGIDVLAETGTGAVVALGDSLTDGNISTHDAYANWPSQLARRLADRRRGRPMAVMNQGLGGNRILHDIRGDSGLRRFDRDVLSQAGITSLSGWAPSARTTIPSTGRRLVAPSVSSVPADAARSVAGRTALMSFACRTGDGWTPISGGTGEAIRAPRRLGRSLTNCARPMSFSPRPISITIPATTRGAISSAFVSVATCSMTDRTTARSGG